MRSYRLYNLTMLFCGVCFVFGSVCVWRGEWAEWRRNVEANKLELTNIQEINSVTTSVDKKIERLKDYETVGSTTTGNLSILQSSNLSSTTSKFVLNTKALPAKINLDVPFTSQAPEKDWGQPWQDACEEAALLMLDAYYKKYNLSPLFAKDEIIKMVQWEEKQGWGRSIEIDKVEIISKDYLKITNSKLSRQSTGSRISSGQIPKIIENPTVEQIKTFVAGGNPVLVVADGKVLPNPHFRNGGPVYHALIIRGYDEDEFITNDPGTQFGKNFKYKYDDLMNAIHEWNGGDVKNGRKVILVIE